MQSEKNKSSNSSVIFAVLCGILILSTIAFGAVDTLALGFLSLISAVILFLWYFDSRGKNKCVYSINFLQLPVLGLITIGLIQLLPLRPASSDILSIEPVNSLSMAPYQTRLAVVQLVVYLIFFAAAFYVLTDAKRQKKIVYLIIFFGALMAVFGILQSLSDPEFIYGIRTSTDANPFASFVYRHHFAGFMEMTIALPLALLFGRATNKHFRFSLVLAALVMGLGIIFTGSRGGIVSFFGVLGFIIAANILKNRADSRNFPKVKKMRNNGRNFAFLGIGLAFIFVVLVIGSFMIDQSIFSRVVTFQTGTNDISNGRIHFWSIAWQIFKDNPIIGSGLDSYGIIVSKYDSWNGSYRIKFAHNDYLQTLSDAGILGFICLISFIYLLFIQGFKKIRNVGNCFQRNIAIGSLAGCFGIIIHSFFDFPLRTPSNTFFFLVLAVLATTSNHISNKKSKNVLGRVTS